MKNKFQEHVQSNKLVLILASLGNNEIIFEFLTNKLI